MKSLGVITLLFLSALCSGQHYRTVLLDTVVFFKNDSGLIKAIRIDTVFFDGSDTVYQNFHTTRYNTAPCSEDNIKGASWLGDKVIMRQDGVEVFLNKNNDSILLKTLAAPGESWKLFELDNGNYLEATVISIQDTSILGVSDSVKTIVLQAMDSTNSSVTHALNGKQIQIGKQLGSIGLLHFYDFPNDTVSYHIADIAIPTRREIYAFEVGDRIQIKYTLPFYPYFSHEYYLYTYLAKTFSASQDTVTYLIEKKTDKYHYSQYGDLRETHIKDTIEETYSDLNSLLKDALPEEVYESDDLLRSFVLRLDSVCGQPTLVLTETTSAVVQLSDSCRGGVLDAGYDEYIYVPGFRVRNNTLSASGFYTEKIIFYQKGACTDGELFTDISSVELTNNAASIYPNPATDVVAVNFNSPLNNPVMIALHDIAGKRIYVSNTVQQFPFRMPTDRLTNGCYFISIHSKEHSIQKKLIIQR